MLRPTITSISTPAWKTRIVGFIIGLLMTAIYLWMASGFISVMLVLYHSYTDNWYKGAEIVIKEVILILALLELIIVFQTYLTMGRVKVTFILDVALVVLIGELISLSYGEDSPGEVFISVFVITILIMLRIVTTKFSPDNEDN